MKINVHVSKYMAISKELKKSQEAGDLCLSSQGMHHLKPASRQAQFG
jgi:hypothetical protein